MAAGIQLDQTGTLSFFDRLKPWPSAMRSMCSTYHLSSIQDLSALFWAKHLVPSTSWHRPLQHCLIRTTTYLSWPSPSAPTYVIPVIGLYIPSNCHQGKTRDSMTKQGINEKAINRFIPLTRTEYTSQMKKKETTTLWGFSGNKRVIPLRRIHHCSERIVDQVARRVGTPVDVCCESSCLHMLQ